MDKYPVIGFIGGGNMAQSLIHGLMESDFDSKRIWVADHHEKNLHKLASEYGIQTDPSNLNIANRAGILVLAVKPKDMRSLVIELKETLLKHRPLIVSIATGIHTTHFERWFGESMAIVRAMPNTPALLRAGATGLYANGRVTEEEKNLAESLLRAVGITVWVNHEHELDTVAALSGSGPAYFFLILEALQESAEALGLPKDIARLLTLQTALGAARMALETDVALSDLKKQVAPPQGITEKALQVLEAGNIRSLLKKTVEAAKARSIEISHQFDQD